MQDDSRSRPGRPPQPSDHPLGQLIRDKRLAKGWSILDLAAHVGIKPTSMALVSAIERGTMAPSEEVAERLAHVLDIPLSLLLEWAQTRHRPRSSAQVEAVRSRYEKTGKPALERLLSSTPVSIEWAAGPRDVITTDAPKSRSDIPVFEAGVDPDRQGVRPQAFLPSSQLPPSLAKALVRPIAFRVSDDDFERLRRPSYETARPLYAIVTRPPVVTIDPREPYAVRRHGRVLLAYIGWDGKELFVLPPPGRPGFKRSPADGPAGLRYRLVGQVVAMMGWVKDPR
jgi:transcriptional regulator with XRE-family HTH domain